jgi:hypothetical protein
MEKDIDVSAPWVAMFTVTVSAVDIDTASAGAEMVKQGLENALRRLELN